MAYSHGIYYMNSPLFIAVIKYLLKCISREEGLLSLIVGRDVIHYTGGDKQLMQLCMEALCSWVHSHFRAGRRSGI